MDNIRELERDGSASSPYRKLAAIKKKKKITPIEASIQMFGFLSAVRTTDFYHGFLSISSDKYLSH